MVNLKNQTLFADVFHNVHKKTPVLESLSHKVAGLKACNFIQQRLQHKCFTVNTAKYLRKVFFLSSVAALLIDSFLSNFGC